MKPKTITSLSMLILTCLLTSCALKNTSKTFVSTATAAAVNKSEIEPVANRGDAIQVLNTNQFKRLITNNSVQLVDVRTAEEYWTTHIEHAVNINVNREDFKSNLKQLDKNKPVFIYCRSGKRSANAAKIMKKAGFTKIMDLEGGILAWEDAELPTYK